ncbi:MAG: hypothetical protein HY902_09965 [Deltaproteobacteria bacterium]|nr:hypothetical protein [Deltaproteobacteria bacterium]
MKRYVVLAMWACGLALSSACDSEPSTTTDVAVSDTKGDSTVDAQGDTLADAAADSQADAVADTVPDTAADAAAETVGDTASLAEFCQGAAPKVQLGSKLANPAVVSSSELVLDCCMGQMLRFHTEALVGSRLQLGVRQMGGAVPPGPHDLAYLPKGLEVWLAQENTAVQATMVGTLQVDLAAPATQPTLVSVCVQFKAPGSPLDGLRLYAKQFPVAGWGWDNRLTLRLLADPNIHADAALAQPLADLKLADDPVVSLMRIAWYVGGAHKLYWDQMGSTAALKTRVGKVGVQGVPFVVEADGERIYLGAFYSLISSQSFAGPTIVMEELTPEGFAILPSYPGTPLGADPRADPRILKVLKQAGKLVEF